MPPIRLLLIQTTIGWGMTSKKRILAMVFAVLYNSFLR